MSKKIHRLKRRLRVVGQEIYATIKALKKDREDVNRAISKCQVDIDHVKTNIADAKQGQEISRTLVKSRMKYRPVIHFTFRKDCIKSERF